VLVLVALAARYQTAEPSSFQPPTED
jgi:hypothetical protein